MTDEFDPLREETRISFDDLGLDGGILKALAAQDFQHPTAIQESGIPPILNGRDLVGVAQTGGGKTAAFVLPILELLMAHSEKPKPGFPRALLLAPTRELAMQIGQCIKDMARFIPLTQCTILVVHRIARKHIF